MDPFPSLPQVVNNVLLAPAHINVGGTTYTTTLKTLTRYPDSKIAKFFNGTLPIAMDPINQGYFLDVDGSVFSHILNFLRYGELILPNDFNQLQLLKKQAEFFEIKEMIEELAGLTKEDRSGSDESKEIVANNIKPKSGDKPEEEKNHISISNVEYDKDSVVEKVVTQDGSGEGERGVSEGNLANRSDAATVTYFIAGSEGSIDIYSLKDLTLDDLENTYIESNSAGFIKHLRCSFSDNPYRKTNYGTEYVITFALNLVNQLVNKGYTICSAVNPSQTSNSIACQFLLVRKTSNISLS